MRILLDFVQGDPIGHLRERNACIVVEATFHITHCRPVKTAGVAMFLTPKPVIYAGQGSLTWGKGTELFDRETAGSSLE